jgi:hypothetical protein
LPCRSSNPITAALPANAAARDHAKPLAFAGVHESVTATMPAKTSKIRVEERPKQGQSVPLGDTGDDETGAPTEEQGISNREGDRDKGKNKSKDEGVPVRKSRK